MKKLRSYDGGRRNRQARRRRVFLMMTSVMLFVTLAALCVILWRLWRPVTLPTLPSGASDVAVRATQEEEETWKVTEAAELTDLADTGNAIVDAANQLARQYDYDKAIAMVQAAPEYGVDEIYANAAAAYEDLKSQCVLWQRYDQITHVFFHSLIVDEELAFNSPKQNDYNQNMVTVDEFKQIIQSMYERDYVLISLHKVARIEIQPDGTEKMVTQPILLPKGKKPFVLSVDDVCYYEYMTGHGFATKLCLDENGKVVNEYIERDGSVSYGSYDVMTLLEDFVAEHPDFSYRGSKGILAFTGYDGVLGYRTSDFWYAENCDYYISTPKNDEEKEKHHTSPNLNIEQDKATARAVAQAIRNLGWEMASHTWGHHNFKSESYDYVAWDTDMWEREVETIIGETDIILYPLGADVGEWMSSEYGPQNAKYMKLKAAGFDYFCNVDSATYWVQINTDNFRQGRRNLDGQMLYKQIVYPERALVTDLFDAEAIFSASRPLPVPGVQ